MVKRLSAIAIVLLAVGCHAQVPPASTHRVSLTWTAPAATSAWSGCTATAPCVYAVYRCTGDATACGTLSSTAWSEVTTPSTRPSGTSYIDASVGGAVYTYVVETVQGSDNSGPSNTTAATVPGIPAPPAVGSPSVAKLTPQGTVGAVTGLRAAE